MSKSVSDSYTKVVDLISSNAVLTANITTPNDIRIDGVVNGSVSTPKRLVIGTKAVVNGNVCANSVDCFGKINGDVVVQTTLTVKSSASIIGSIETAALSVELGAFVSGKCNMVNTCK